MRSHLLVTALFAVGCREVASGPFRALPLDGRIDVDGLDGVVHVARDRAGIAHVHATTPRDLGFAQGYVMAHDRLPQLDLMRRLASGTLAELYGNDDGAIRSDIEMRFHRMRTFAEETWNQLQVSDQTELVALLDGFAAGVNTYVDHAQRGDWPLDPLAAESGTQPLFRPMQFADWSPVDSIVILRFFTFSQSWTLDEELELSELAERARVLPAGHAVDLLALAPIGPRQAPAAATGTQARPAVPLSLFAAARAFFERAFSDDSSLALGAQAFLRPYVGSNVIAIGPMLAADMHGRLFNPSQFYPMHQILEDAVSPRDIAGLYLLGCPVAIAGTNRAIAWAPATGTHDVNDLYLEQLVDGDTASVHDGMKEPLGYFTEEIRIGDHGTISGSRMQTYAVVPRHGPIIPGHPPGVALSVKYTGYAATREIVQLWALGHVEVTTIGDAERILRDFRHGSHFVVADHNGASALITYADVPERPAATRHWSPGFRDGTAPFFVLDGTNPAHESTRTLDITTLPGTFNFDGAIVVADNDLTGATFDGNPLDAAYLGFAYGNGLRAARITELLDTTAVLGPTELAQIQHDTRSNMGAAIRDALVAVLASDLSAYTAAERAQLALARDVLVAWDLETPIAAIAADASSAATLLFNTWMVRVVDRLVTDDFTAIGYVGRFDDDRVARLVYRVLADRDALAKSAGGEPLVCGTSCNAVILGAMLDSVQALTRDDETPADWRWGAVHGLRMRALPPALTGFLAIPSDTEPSSTLPVAGDMFAIARADGGWESQQFDPQLGVAYRLLALAGSELRLELPTGTVFDRRDRHYRDLLEKSYLTRTPIVVPLSIDEIVSAGESRWELR